jgi:hypothetical protein
MKIALDALPLLLGRRHHDIAARRERLDAFYERGFSASEEPAANFTSALPRAATVAAPDQSKPGQQEDHPDSSARPGRHGLGSIPLPIPTSRRHSGHPSAIPTATAIGTPRTGTRIASSTAETIGRASQ